MGEVPEAWLQRVRLTAAEPNFWLETARKLRQAAEDLWIAGNNHQRNPGSELGVALLFKWTNPETRDQPVPETGGSTREQCFMMFGFALENLAKAIIVCHDPVLVRRDKLQKWHGHGHDLGRLFDWAKIPLSDGERQVLDRAARLIAWKGRYPVPMSFYEAGAQDPLIGYIAVGDSWPPDEYARLSVLYDKAKAEVQRTIQDVPALSADHDFGADK
ncbi:MAG TPA: hypothetical protein DCK98_15910 [Chloroflexi bacterium]|nr:hypothetical protein [Chloroflexota bacterium]